MGKPQGCGPCGAEQEGVGVDLSMRMPRNAEDALFGQHSVFEMLCGFAWGWGVVFQVVLGSAPAQVIT